MASLFPCPSCGGQLKYDVDSHQMKCESCGSHFGVQDYISEDITSEREMVICPNCGGEVTAPSLEGMNFCPYCGSEITNAEHFSEEGYPELILPFEISKARTVSIYQDMVSRVPCLPDDLKNVSASRSFVGLYTPYWIYDYRAEGQVTVPVKKTTTTGNYVNEYKADLVADLNCDLSVGVDGSQTLDDTVSAKIEPFYYEKMEKFNPCYMAGFYAENSTVDPSVYEEVSGEKARRIVYDRLNAEASRCDGYSLDPMSASKVDSDLENLVSRKSEKCRGAYLPLWFLTTRKNNRVSYTVINGQTGTAHADLPVDLKKFSVWSLLISAVCAAVFLLLFAVFGTIDMRKIPYITMVLSSVLTIAASLQSGSIYRREHHLDDRGYNPSAARKSGKKKKPDTRKTAVWLTIAFIAVAVVLSFCGSLAVWLLLIASLVVMIMKARGSSAVTAVLAFVGSILSVADILVDPFQDMLLYGLMILNLLILIYDAIRLAKEYNRLASNPLPQFQKKGGRLNEKYS